MKSDLEGFKAVLYARVSTSDKGQTVETQEREMRAWCDRKGVEIVAYYSEEMTGTTLNRPELKKAISEFMFGGADILLAYDQSRITRGDDLKAVQDRISPGKLMFVTMDIDPDNVAAKAINALKSVMDKDENDVRKEKTRLGMLTRKNQGKNIGRPAKVMFNEDVNLFPKGRYVDDFTIPITEYWIFEQASKGHSVYYVAEKLLNVSGPTLMNELRLRGTFPNAKGVKDRYTRYMTLYSVAVGTKKGCGEERVGFDPENTEERAAVE